jgi:DNA-binding NarL/FixJ family response regulator
VIRIGLAVPALALRIGLREVLRGLPDLEVVAEAARPQDLPPVDVLVITSADLLGDPAAGSPPVLLLTDDPSEAGRLAELSAAFVLPVWGALPLDASADELAAAVRALAEGLWAGAPALIQGMFGRLRVGLRLDLEPVVEPLTDRERQVLQLAAEGLANKQIAAALEISENTVKFHLSSLYAKMGVTSRTEAVRAGARRGWVVL